MSNYIKVYLASPYTKGDTAQNVAHQLRMANELMNQGLYPYVPLLTHFQHMYKPRNYEDWIRHDLVWLSQCDCLLRFGAESEGADMEVEYALENNIPVCYSLEELYKKYKLIR